MIRFVDALCVGMGCSELGRRLPYWRRTGIVLATLIVATELWFQSPHFFAYINPVFGGSRAVPPVLHDSNFDGAQDLWRLENWIEKHPLNTGQIRYICIHGNVPDEAIRFKPMPPPDVTARMLQYRYGTDEESDEESDVTKMRQSWRVELIIMRGLGVPAAWTKMYGTPMQSVERDISEILTYPPDEFLTPTLAIYRDRDVD